MNDLVTHLDTEYYSKPEMCDADRPGYQTIQYLLNDPKFDLLRNSFLWSARSYVNDPELIRCLDLNSDIDLTSWCLLTSKSSDPKGNPVENMDDSNWHCHNLNQCRRSVSGIFYLKLPKSPGGETLFHIGGNYFELPGNLWNWFIFPTTYNHRPGKVYSPEKRYVIGADIFFTKFPNDIS